MMGYFFVGDAATSSEFAGARKRVLDRWMGPTRRQADRGGKQQIYVMGANGGQAQRISFGDGAYSTPVWSPRGAPTVAARRSIACCCACRSSAA